MDNTVTRSRCKLLRDGLDGIVQPFVNRHRHQWELEKALIIYLWLPHFIPSDPQMHRPIHGSQKNGSENKIGMKEEIK